MEVLASPPGAHRRRTFSTSVDTQPAQRGASNVTRAAAFMVSNLPSRYSSAALETRISEGISRAVGPEVPVAPVGSPLHAGAAGTAGIPVVPVGSPLPAGTAGTAGNAGTAGTAGNRAQQALEA